MQSVNAHLKPTVSNSKMATRPCPSLQQPVNMWCRNDSQVWVVLAIYFYHGVEWNGYFVVYQFSANKWAQNIPAACPTSTPRDFGYQALHNLSLHFVLGGPRSVIVEPFMHLTTSIYRYLSIVCANHECCSGGGGGGGVAGELITWGPLRILIFQCWPPHPFHRVIKTVHAGFIVGWYLNHNCVIFYFVP